MIITILHISYTIHHTPSPSPPLVSLWEMVKHWLDPRTQAKIEILGSGPETARRLLEFVSPATLPPSLGGTAPTDLVLALVRHTLRPLTDYV
ncbi:hypothetical protein EON64_16540, partial [archaeon]